MDAISFRFSADCKAMLGFEIGIYWKLCWALIGPLFILVRDRHEISKEQINGVNTCNEITLDI